MPPSSSSPSGTRKAVPAPSTVSPALQKVIEAPARALPEPKTAEEWRQTISAIDDEGVNRVRALAAELGVTVVQTAVAGIKCFRITPAEVAPEKRHRLLVHLHGGGHVLNGGEAGTWEGILVAHCSNTVVLSVDFRMAPAHPWPADIEDAVTVWRDLIEDHDPACMALFGSSAGAGTAMATILQLQASGLALPGALFLGSPTADLTKTGDTWFTSEHLDSIIPVYEGFVEGAFALYVAGQDMKDPLISPIYGDLEGFPPTILISGTRDILLSDTVRTHRKLRQAGVDADLHVFEGQSHGHFIFCFPAPESIDAFGEIARFFDRHLV